MKKKGFLVRLQRLKNTFALQKKNRLSVLLFLHIFMWVIQKEGKYILFFEYEKPKIKKPHEKIYQPF